MLQPDLILSWGSLFGEKKLGDVTGWNAKGVATYLNTNTRAGGHPRTLENEYSDILSAWAGSLMWRTGPRPWWTG